MTSSLTLTEFTVLVRHSGVPLSEAEIALLHEGYGLLQRLVDDLEPPVDGTLDPALVFVPGAR